MSSKRTLKKGEARIGMDAFFRTTKGEYMPHRVVRVSDRGSYDQLTVSKVSKSGKTHKKQTTCGNNDLWI
jgi:hypothetical protein